MPSANSARRADEPDWTLRADGARMRRGKLRRAEQRYANSKRDRVQREVE
jgi:hypothetical protein